MPRKKMPDTVKSTFIIPAKLHKALTYLANRRGTTYSQLLRDLVREFVVRELKAEQELARTQAATPQEDVDTDSATSSDGELRSEDGEPAAAGDGA